MSEQINVPANEVGVIRLFTLDLPEGEIDSFRAPDYEGDEDAPTALEIALGGSYLDTDFVEIFPVSNLEGLGLSGYLTQGLGIAEGDIQAERSRLDAVRGVVVVVLSSAFGGVAQTLAPRAPLRWIGTYTEERAPVKFRPLPSASAAGEVAGPVKSKPSDAAMSGRVAMVALLVLFALVGVMIWVAG